MASRAPEALCPFLCTMGQVQVQVSAGEKGLGGLEHRECREHVASTVIGRRSAAAELGEVGWRT